MTVEELIDYLRQFPADANVAIKVSNSDYLESIGDVGEFGVRSFWGKDRKSVVIRGDGQIGAICRLSDLENADEE